jgi:negative regulator of flagellin synthesis FlgM
MKVITNTPPQTQGNSAVDKTKLTDKNTVADKNKAKTSASHAGSAVEISDQARLMQKAFEAARVAPTATPERIAQIKKQIAEGTYRVDSADLADKIINEHLNSDFGKNNL